MNILRIVYEWPPGWDGLTPGPFELTRAQSARGHRVHVLCGGWPTHATASLPNVEVTRLPVALPRLSLFATTAPAVLPAMIPLMRWADVVHGHGHLPACFHGMRTLLGGRVPYVLHLHVTAAGRRQRAEQVGSSPDAWSRLFEWPLHERSDRRGCRVADAVVCVSEGVRAEALELCGATAERTSVLTNGVNTSLFSPDGPSERASLGWPTDCQVMLFVGALVARKRVSVLVEALQYLGKRWRLLIVGRGPEEASLRRLTAQKRLGDRVRFWGYHPYPQLPAVYRSADVLVLPSSYEGCPKVALEALSCGVPVMAGGFRLAAGPLRDAICRLADDVTPELLAEAVVGRGAVRADSVLRRDMDWAQRAETLDAVYRRAIDMRDG